MGEKKPVEKVHLEFNCQTGIWSKVYGKVTHMRYTNDIFMYVCIYIMNRKKKEFLVL